MIGETFDGRYKIVRLLGEGGMGAVYEAEDGASQGAKVAIKVITANVAKNQNLLARFHREAKAAAAIATDEIVQVLDTGTDPTSGLPYMVMEMLDGEDLSALFKRLGKLPVDLALRIGAQACITLHKAHEARVIHRDIKPANLFLTRGANGERRVKLLDFGVAKIKQDSGVGVDTSGLTRTGSMLGSPLYMSPEQARGQKVIDARADIWSLGVVLYQALTGRRPHQDVDGLGELIIAICSELPPPVQDFAPWVPSEVAAIVHGAMQFDPNDRFPSAQAMLEAIREQLPAGEAISEAMLVPLTPEQKAYTAPRLASVEVSPAKSRTVIRSGRAPVDDVAATVALEPSVSDAHARSTPGQGFQTAPAAPPPAAPPLADSKAELAKAPAPSTKRAAQIDQAKKARETAQVVMIVAAVLLALIAGYFVWRTTRAHEPTGEHAARHVELTIEPPDATVHVNNQPVAVNRGRISLEGQLGSVHHVRVNANGRSEVVSVTISDRGALPDKIDLSAKP